VRSRTRRRALCASCVCVSPSVLYLCSDPAFVAALLRLLGQNGKLILEEGLAAVRGRWLTRLA